jgi:uncharacterized membrane protein
MKTKNLFVGSVIGTIVYFLLGWLFYGVLFTDIFPSTGTENMLFIFLGCMFFGILVAYVVVSRSGLTDWISGAKVGAVVGAMYSASMNFYMYASMEPDYNKIVLDFALSILMAGIVGAAIAFVNKKI